MIPKDKDPTGSPVGGSAWYNPAVKIDSPACFLHPNREVVDILQGCVEEIERTMSLIDENEGMEYCLSVLKSTAMKV